MENSGRNETIDVPQVTEERAPQSYETKTANKGGKNQKNSMPQWMVLLD